MRLQLSTILLITTFLPGLVLAQKQSLISFGLSANSYRGELSNYSDWSAGLQIGWIFDLNKKWGGSLQAGFATARGSDRNFALQANTSDPAINTFVKTNFLFVNYALRFTFLKKNNISAYLSQGVGFMRFVPQDEFGNDLIDQDDTRAQNEEYRNLSFMLPTGLGVSYIFPNSFGVTVEGNVMNTTSDYLDNISDLGDSGSDNILSARLLLLIPFNR
ncbi:MAG: hypothetical protein AAF519_09385 [Bacteroidota bacterium]